MSVNPYMVETRAQGAVILADSKALTLAVAEKFQGLGIDSHTSREGLKAYLVDHDLDYAVVVLTPSLTQWIKEEGRESWEILLSSLNSGNLLVAQRPWDNFELDVPNSSRRVALCEYLDLEGEGSPTLDRLIKEARSQGTITLPEDGVVEYSLLSLKDLSSALVRAVTARHWSPGDLTLANPETLSLLGLAHTLAASFKKQIKINFAAPSFTVFSYPWEELLLLYAKYGIVMVGAVEGELAQYLADFGGSPHPTQPPVPHSSLVP